MANNVIWSAIFLGNAADMDTNESSTALENSSPIIRTFGSSSDRLASHVVEVDTDSSDSNMSTNNVGTSDTVTYDIGSGPETHTLDTGALVSATVRFTDGTTTSENVVIYQDTAGNLFLVAQDGQTVLASKPIESITVSSVLATGSSDSQFNYDTVQFVCFAPGTMILCPDGERPVEALGPGDPVVTADHGVQRLRWTGQRELTFGPSPETQKPILIRAGALGPGCPRDDLIVSPQHRILLGGAEVRRLTGDDQALGIAAALTGLPGVRRMFGRRQVTYHSLLFERHEIIFANGTPVESLYPGRYAMTLFDPRQRGEILKLFPRLLADPVDGFGPKARPLLRRREVVEMVRLGGVRSPALVPERHPALT